MEKYYLDLNLYEFLDAITDKEIVYELTFEDSEDPTGFSKLIGTKKQHLEFLDELIKEYGTSEGYQKLYRDMDQREPYTFNEDLGEIEVYDYLEHKTNNFDENKTRIVLNEIDCYHMMDYSERIYDKGIDYYKKHNIDLPMEESFNPISQKKEWHVNHKEVRKQGDPFGGWRITRAMTILKDKLKITGPSSTLRAKEYILENGTSALKDTCIEKLTIVYRYCISTGVFDPNLSCMDFINCVQKTNFKKIYEASGKNNTKSKCKYIIYIISRIMNSDEWYKKTANSINTEPNKCSGASVPAKWKKEAGALK